ncbi:FAD-binding oxidoreductase [Stappia sp. ES.058]|uniref:NAD(P)/FAD-dependent oxidoreductase n=1 Tax=Stappia sp. ES.058 TaxID=1881061 RepID=UPI00087CEA9F|nr:FAD-binding oxidoreductase [Stappia sp. ES.058]SDU22794.1 D-amino-acid dehydrogenase [Stappia sp. ES.058]
MRSYDVIVLGGGISGVCAALHLQARGMRVLLVDRAAPGDEASRANTGILARDGFSPLAWPHAPAEILARLLKPAGQMRIDLRSLPGAAPFLRAAHVAVQTGAAARIGRAVAPLQAVAAGEHLALARAASALRFFRRTGWIKIYRHRASYEASEEDRHFARIFGVAYTDLSAADLVRLEPHLVSFDHAGLYWPDTQSVSSPGGVTKAYARLFRERGGDTEIGKAETLIATRDGWSVRTSRGEASGTRAVIALGAGAPAVLSGLGVALPLATIRGYHRHFRAVSGVTLSRPITDSDNGYTLTPMERGLRLVGGHELTRVDRPLRASALQRAETAARALMPVGAQIEDTPIPGLRLCMPDGLPVMGNVTAAPGLWLALGNERSSFGLGAAMGRLLAETMTGERPFTDPAPYSPTRFLSD